MRQFDRFTVIETLDDIRLGHIGRAFTEAGLRPEIINLERGDALPPIEDIQKLGGLMVMGSPWSVHDPNPQVQAINRLTREAYRTNTPLAGVCFGHQSVGLAAGFEILPASTVESGFYKVQLTDAGKNSVFTEGFPPEFDALQEHNEMVVIPADARNATELAIGNGMCQMAQFGPYAVTVQYHNEPEKTVPEKKIWESWKANASGLKAQDPDMLDKKFDATYPQRIQTAVQFGRNYLYVAHHAA